MSAACRYILTERDIAVVTDVYKYRYLSVSQVQRLHFPSLQTTYRRLRGLVASGYLAGFLAPPITEHLYYIEPKGAELVAATLGVEVSDLKWTKASRSPKDYYFLRHFLVRSSWWQVILLGKPQSGLVRRTNLM